MGKNNQKQQTTETDAQRLQISELSNRDYKAKCLLHSKKYKTSLKVFIKL